MSDVTNEDWAKIHAKAWRDAKFRELLECDPTAAVKQYGQEVGKTFKKIVRLEKRPPEQGGDHIPPACC